MAVKKSALGRGLGALIEDAGVQDEVKEIRGINEIEISKIEANPYQPRTKFDEDALNDLSASIKELGIIQPVTVRKLGNGNYQLISGERRFRASKLAGLTMIPAYVRVADDQGMLEMALVENIQREDLDAIEVAISYQRLMEECSLTQELLSERVGKKRSTVSNYLRLLKLPAEIQLGIIERKISMGHARSLVNIKDTDTQLMIFQQVLKYDFSVRKVEDIVRELNEEKKDKDAQPSTVKYTQPEEYDQLKSHLVNHFESKVDFKINDKGKGKIVIPFKNPEDLERILGILDKINS